MRTDYLCPASGALLSECPDALERLLERGDGARHCCRTEGRHAVLWKGCRDRRQRVTPSRDIEHVSALDAMDVNVDEPWHDEVPRQVVVFICAAGAS